MWTSGQTATSLQRTGCESEQRWLLREYAGGITGSRWLKAVATDTYIQPHQCLATHLAMTSPKPKAVAFNISGSVNWLLFYVILKGVATQF